LVGDVGGFAVLPVVFAEFLSGYFLLFQNIFTNSNLNLKGGFKGSANLPWLRFVLGHRRLVTCHYVYVAHAVHQVVNLKVVADWVIGRLKVGVVA